MPIAPGPRPGGIANRHNEKKLAETENPSSAKAVIAVLKAETLFVPNRLITLALIRIAVRNRFTLDTFRSVPLPCQG